ncbi:MAG: phosphatidate cytidylyltransferase, partial [Bacteroidales bacterium]
MKKSLITRSITGIIFVGVMLLAIFLGYEYTAILFFICMLLGLHEMLVMLRHVGVRPLPGLVYALSMVLYVYTCFCVMPIDISEDSVVWHWVDLLPLLMLLLGLSTFIFEMYRKSEKPWANISATLGSVFYIALPFALLNYLRNPFLELEYGNANILFAFFV